MNFHLVPNPYRALGGGGRSRHGPSRSRATEDRAIGPQDVAASQDKQDGGCASEADQSVKRPPMSFSHFSTAVSRMRVPCNKCRSGVLHSLAGSPRSARSRSSESAPITEGRLSWRLLVRLPPSSMPCEAKLTIPIAPVPTLGPTPHPSHPSPAPAGSRRRSRRPSAPRAFR